MLMTDREEESRVRRSDASSLYSRAAQKVTYYSCKKCYFLALVGIARLGMTSGVGRHKSAIAETFSGMHNLVILSGANQVREPV